MEPIHMSRHTKKKKTNKNISACKNMIFKNNPLKETKILHEYLSRNSIITNLKFQHNSQNIYHLSKILI